MKGNYNDKGKNPLKRKHTREEPNVEGGGIHGRRKGSGSVGATGGDYYHYERETRASGPARSKGDDRFGTSKQDH